MIGLFLFLYILGFVLILIGIGEFNRKVDLFFKIDIEFAFYKALGSWFYIFYMAALSLFRYFLESDFYSKINKWYRGE